MVITLLMSTLLGVLSGLGIGGGSLLILWLTLGLGADSQTARGVNLLFFLPAALISVFFRWKQGSLPIKKALPAMVSGAVSAAVFTMLAQQMDVLFLKKAFGILLLATGVREILWKSK